LCKQILSSRTRLVKRNGLILYFLLRNHAESSIHTKEVHTRSSLPPDHPTLSQNLTKKLSS
jgi:hypothetical protein